jgi:hypothetical protein
LDAELGVASAGARDWDVPPRVGVRVVVPAEAVAYPAGATGAGTSPVTTTSLERELELRTKEGVS